MILKANDAMTVPIGDHIANAPLGSFTQQDGETLDGSGTPSVQFGWICRDDCVSDLPGRLQRYVAYVPDLPRPANGYASMLPPVQPISTIARQGFNSRSTGTRHLRFVYC